MPINKLTDAICRKAAPGEKPRKLSDGHGLYLFVSPAGAKVWRVGYRKDGKEGTHVIGPYPLISLADARIKRDEFRRALLDGIDVRAKPKRSITLSEAIKMFWVGVDDGTGTLVGGRRDVTDGYRDNAVRGLAMHLEPDLGKTPIGTITKETLLPVLMKLDAAGKFVYARRVRMWASLVFEWAMEHGHCTVNPAAQIKPEKAFGKKPVRHHASLELGELPDFLLRLSLERDIQSVLACRLLALTWVRTTELRMMRWTELDGDLWRVPLSRMKMRRAHMVPLSRQAQALLDELRARSRSEYVFPSFRSLDKPMSENSVLYLVHRIGYKNKMTGHGFRSVASTWANENGYNRDHIELQLAHDEVDESRGAYNHAQYLSQRRKMLQDWADYLDQVDPSGAQSGQTPPLDKPA